MSDFPELHVGQADHERDAMLTEECAKLIATGLHTDDVCCHLGVTREALRAARQRHAAKQEFDLFIENGSDRTRVCHCVTTKPFTETCIAVFRAYKNSLQKLSLPGWTLTDGSHRVSVSDLQHALMSGKVVAPKLKNKARRKLGMKEVKER